MDYYFYSLEGQNILRLDSCEKNYYIEKVNTIQKDKDPHVLYMAHNDFLEIGRYPYYKEEAPVFSLPIRKIYYDSLGIVHIDNHFIYRFR